GLRMTSGQAETPSDWMTAPTPLSARFTVASPSASPAIFSSLGRSIGILRADRASARTESSASRAAFTVSRPIPLLAPMRRTVATASCSTARTRLAHHHVRYRQQHRKIGERLEIYLGSLFETLDYTLPPDCDEAKLDALAWHILDKRPMTLLGLAIRARAEKH